MKSSLKTIFAGSIRVRLSLIFSVVFGTALIISSFLTFQIFTYAHQDDFDAFLFNHAVDIAEYFKVSPKEVLDGPENWVKKRRLYDVQHAFAIVVDPNGKVLARSPNMVGKNPVFFEKSDFVHLESGKFAYRTIPNLAFAEGEHRGRAHRIISRRFRSGGKKPLLIQIAAPLTFIEDEKKELLWLLATIIPFSLGISSLLGYWTSRRAFTPVVEMTKKTAQFEMRNLKERIEVRESDIELKDLGKTLNQLLERVENTISAQERFVADASHQLKTPLSIIRGELELLLARAELPGEMEESLKNAAQEVTQLISLVENLLILARMDAGLGVIAFQTIRLDEILSEALTRLQRVAEKKDVRLLSELTPYRGLPEAAIDFEMKGDADLIRCLMENLIENAIKYSEPHGSIWISLKEDDSGFELRVADHGKGMSESEISTIFDRFWRDPRKSVSTGGAGLGLAIAKKICEIHASTITAQGIQDKGSTFLVHLKKF